MADEEQVAILPGGADAWNRWRRENRDLLPDLHRADLSGLELSGTNLKNAALSGGTFTEGRKPILHAVRQELRQRDYVAVIFDLDVPASRDTDETLTMLARMARFVVAGCATRLQESPDARPRHSGHVLPLVA